MANEVLLSIGKDEIEGLRLMSELKNRLDYQSEISYKIRKAEEKSKEQVARNLLLEGLPVEVIQITTGLSTETIQSL